MPKRSVGALAVEGAYEARRRLILRRSALIGEAGAPVKAVHACQLPSYRACGIPVALSACDLPKAVFQEIDGPMPGFLGSTASDCVRTHRLTSHSHPDDAERKSSATHPNHVDHPDALSVCLDLETLGTG